MLVFNIVLSSLMVGLRIVLAGWFWAGETGLRLSGVLDRICRAAALGVVLNLLPAFILAPFGWWNPRYDYFVWFLIVIAGFARSLKVKRAYPRAVLEISAGVLLLAALSFAAAVMPLRSEWIAGGWDPGIYVNNAVAMAQRDGVQPRTDTVYSLITPEDVHALSRGNKEYREIFPGVPVIRENGSILLYFSYFNSIAGAWLFRLGGFDWLFKLPVFAGFWGVFVATGFFRASGMTWKMSMLGLLAWVLSPLWWYQQAIPTTEMMYILLLTAGLLFYAHSRKTGHKTPVAAAMCFFAATLNHFNFPVVFGLLFVVLALLERREASAHADMRILTCAAGVVAGFAWGLLFSPSIIVRLQEEEQVLQWVLLPFVALLACAMLIVRLPLPSRIQDFIYRLLPGCCSVAGAASILLAFTTIMAESWGGGSSRLADLPCVGFFLFRLARLQVFGGPAAFMMAGVGLLLMGNHDKEGSRRFFRYVVCAFGFAVLVFCVMPGIAGIYPWALRRYLPVLIPFLAAAQGYAFWVILAGSGWSSRLSRWLAAGLMAAAVILSAQRSFAAARVGDYIGVKKALDDVASRLDPRDIIIADDAKWGTPLLLSYNFDVINGSLLWRSSDPARQNSFMDALNRMSATTGRRVVWLTSTAKGMDIYPPQVELTQLMWEATPFSYQTVIHSSRARSFATETNNKIFRLYLKDNAEQAGDSP